MGLQAHEIAAIKESGQRLAGILSDLADAAVAGANLLDIEALAKEKAEAAGGRPSFLGFHGYPAASCLSVNEGIVHCIPTDYTLKDGDILTIDMGLEYQGMHTDAAITVPIGEVSADAKRLLGGTYQALLSGIEQVGSDKPVSAISKAIEATLKEYRLTTFKEFVGHQIGHSLHEGFFVPNFYEGHGPDPILAVGQALAIEPITGIGAPEVVFSADGWSTQSADGKPAAQFETTVLVTPSGYEILVPIEPIVKRLKIS